MPRGGTRPAWLSSSSKGKGKIVTTGPAVEWGEKQQRNIIGRNIPRRQLSMTNIESGVPLFFFPFDSIYYRLANRNGCRFNKSATSAMDSSPAAGSALSRKKKKNAPSTYLPSMNIIFSLHLNNFYLHLNNLYTRRSCSYRLESMKWLGTQPEIHTRS